MASQPEPLPVPCKLSVNVNAIAYLRNRRNLPWPSVEGLGRVALEAGAVGLTVHPRPDERHIRRTIVTALGQMLRRDFPNAEYNMRVIPMPGSWRSSKRKSRIRSRWFLTIRARARRIMAGTLPPTVRC